ncbi:MAG TPA: hypothetical protein VN874_06630, partial [Myxococcales bacterium]|nr:hypothetical protein [Myxococcales bacterium]
AQAYGVFGFKGLPYAQRATFVIDKDGKVVKVLEGADALDPAPALASCPLHKNKNQARNPP